MLTIPYENNYVETNGARLHVVTAGPEDGKPVMLLHGFPEFWYGWRYQIPALAKAGFRVIVPDQRGYNLSAAPKDVGSYKPAILTQDILSLLDHFGIEKVKLVGHDWGAVLGWGLALTSPHRVERFCSLCVPHPTVGLEFLSRSFKQMKKSWYAAFFQIPGLPDWLSDRNNFTGGEWILHWSGKPGSFSDEEIAYYKEAWSNSGGFTSMINWYRAFARYGLLAPKEIQIHIPVLLQASKRDVVLSHEMAEESMKLCDNGKLVLYENATHWLQHDEPDTVNQHLLDFLNQ